MDYESVNHRKKQLIKFFKCNHFFPWKEISQIKHKEALQAHASQQVCYVHPLEAG